MPESDASSDARPSLPWRGFHHIALVTRDLDATRQFYGDVLDMQVGSVSEHPQRGRHCFIKLGSDETETWGLHFFEEREARELVDAHAPITFAFAPGAVQHIAFALPDEAAALELRKRLSTNGAVMTDVIDLGRIKSTLFRDNNGILLEAAWPKSPSGSS